MYTMHMYTLHMYMYTMHMYTFHACTLVFVCVGKVEETSKIYKNKLQLVEEQRLEETANCHDQQETTEPLQLDSSQVEEGTIEQQDQ